LVREFRHLVGNLPKSQAAVGSFEQILGTAAPTFNVLNEMLLTGFLEAFIPEFGEIVNRIQYDEYHLYPVDKHSLRTVQTIKAFGSDGDPTGDRFCGDLYRGLKNRKLLLWAGLLHDVGKGRTGSNHTEEGAAMARRIVVRMGYGHKDADTVAFLVDTHLLLIKTATRRDINDEQTAITCARIVQDPERLRMLYLLTVADSAATGPSAWNDWTAALLRSLFLEVLKTIEKGELATDAAVESAAAKKAAVLNTAGSPAERSRSEKLFMAMSPRYLLYTDADEIPSHMALYHRLGDRQVVWDVAAAQGADTRRVTVCARDLPGLFANICGVFTVNGIDILSAQIYTWRNNTALDIFEVKPPPDRIFEAEKWDHALAQLEQALAGTVDLKALLRQKAPPVGSTRPAPGGKPAKVVVDNESSSFFTIVEVYAADYPGLLFNIADALYLNQLDIWVAKIGTGVDQVVDVFYVRDFDGQRVDEPGRINAIRKAVLAAAAPIENKPMA
jgi:[protein-PII] uridylyltransferase